MSPPKASHSFVLSSVHHAHTQLVDTTYLSRI
nr:MAG TPA: hypothetical protein [Caudoviricetes sp.]